MIRYFSYIVGIFFISVSASPVFGQLIFPITANIQSTPPHSGNLSDLVAVGSNKLALVLNLQDAEELSHQVRLRITIEGNGISLVTKSNINFAPVEVTYGSPQILRELDLQEYFNPAAFDFIGYTLNDYLNEGGLPDGFYTICVEAFNYARFDEGAASNSSCTVINASQLDAPVITAPIGMLENPVTPQNLPLQWMNMHNVSIPVEHEIEIFAWPYSSTLSPDQIVQFDLPFFTTTVTSANTYNITPSDPPLQRGERYLIRVRAQDLSMNYQFKNNGWSEIQSFGYDHPCPAPRNVIADGVTTDEIALSWQAPNGQFNTYVIRYREKREGANWYENSEVLDEHTITGLDDNTIYQVQVQTLCGGTTAGVLSDIIEVKTDSFEFDPSEYNCGDEASFPQPLNLNPIEANNLAPGDWITIGGFQAKIVTIEAGNAPSSFSGSCHVKVDWLGQRFYAEFQNLYVNTDREVYDGNIVCRTNGLKSLQGFMSPDSIRVAGDTTLHFCGDTIRTDSTVSAAVVNPTAGDVIVPNGADDPYNPYNPSNPYDPTDYSDENNPYTPDNPYDETSLWNPYNIFNPYDPTDYSDPNNPYDADNPFDGEALNQYSSSSTIPFSDEMGVKVLPYGLTTNGVSGEEYTIALDKMAFTTRGAVMNAYASLPIPQGNGRTQYAAFSMQGVKFHPGGLLGESRLVLNSDVSFKLGPTSLVTFNKGGDSYVSWDCHGFLGVSVSGNVQVCRDVLVPIDWSGRGIDSSSYVTGFFRATMPEWGEFVADLSITPFEVPGLEDWAFVVENAVFDFSESLTPSTVAFPSDYSHADVLGGDGSSSPAWTGFYLRALKIRLPKKFSQTADSIATDTSATNPTSPPPAQLDSAAIDSIVARIYNQDQLEFGAENVLVDETGVTFYVYASNILSLDQGRVGTWGFGIDSVGLGVQSNVFKKAYLKGKVDVPALSSVLGYECLIQPGAQYDFTISIEDTLSINAWRANVLLYGDSYISMTYTDSIDDFSATCNLVGEASITAPMSQNPNDTSTNLALPKLRFQNLKFMTVWPYVELGTWALTSETQGGAAKFPVTINEIGLYQNHSKDKVAIVVDAAINLKPSAENGFGCEGRMGIINNISIDPNTGREKWTFDRVRVDKFAIDISTAAFELKGALLFYEKIPDYGAGFRAGLQLKVKPGIGVEAIAQFGRVDGFRYFFVDAMVAFGQQGIPLGASGMAVYGFGGGVSYKMRREGFQDLQLPDASITPPPNDTLDTETPYDDPFANGVPVNYFDPGSGNPLTVIPPGADPGDIPIVERLGYSLSGTQYIPDSTTGIGVKAMIALGAVKKELFYGLVTFEIIFTSSGGLATIALQGDLSFLTPPDVAGNPAPDPALRAQIDMVYNNIEKSFYARLAVYVTVAGGIIRGAYDNPPNLAGIGIIYADPHDWYIHLGRPDKPVKVKLDISKLFKMKDKSQGSSQGGVPNEFLNTGPDSLGPTMSMGSAGLLLAAYFDAGTILPEFPPLPDELLSILGSRYQPMQRFNSDFSNGSGLLFGAHLAVELSDLNFLFFYAEFYAGLGFDAMLRDYGTAVRCDGIDTDGPIGINGWYATGQIYAYLKGAVGIRVKIFKKEKKFEILSIGAAAVLQGRLPNPIWLKGAVTGSYSILGGLIKGNCYFEFEIGEECILIGGGSPADDFIDHISPETGNENVSVFNRPRAAFSFAVDHPFEWTNVNDETKFYRAVVSKFHVVSFEGSPNNPTNIQNIEGELNYNDLKTVAAFTPFDILPGNSQLKLTVRVDFQVKDSWFDNWGPMVDENGNTLYDEEIGIFSTDPAPDIIPHSNIAYSYPVLNQLYYLQNEANTGFIQLKQGQPYLFKNTPEFDLDASLWNQKMGMSQNGSVVELTDINYNSGQRRVSFGLPQGVLDNETITAFKLINIPVNASEDINDELDSVFVAYVDGDWDPSYTDSISTTIRQSELTSSDDPLRAKSFFDGYFRTSTYNSWTEKVNSFDFTNQSTVPMFFDYPASQLTIDELIGEIIGNEEFDDAELNGYLYGDQYIQPLVSPMATLNATPSDWFNRIQDTLYNHVPNNDISLDWRDVRVFGTPPQKAVTAMMAGDAPALTEIDILSNNVLLTDVFSAIRYQIPYYSVLDRNQLRHRVISYYLSQPTIPDWAQAIMDWSYPTPPLGNYQIKLQYRLPGETTPTSSVNKTMTNATN